MPAAVASRLRLEGEDSPRLVFDAEAPLLGEEGAAAQHTELVARGMLELAGQGRVRLGLGRIVALYDRSSTSYHIR
jgi:hypothetical protein